MIVVPVLIINCHVSLNPSIGPERAQTISTNTAIKNVAGRPANDDVRFANLVKNEPFRFAITPCTSPTYSG